MIVAVLGRVLRYYIARADERMVYMGVRERTNVC